MIGISQSPITKVASLKFEGTFCYFISKIVHQYQIHMSICNMSNEIIKYTCHVSINRAIHKYRFDHGWQVL